MVTLMLSHSEVKALYDSLTPITRMDPVAAQSLYRVMYVLESALNDPDVLRWPDPYWGFGGCDLHLTDGEYNLIIYSTDWRPEHGPY